MKINSEIAQVKKAFPANKYIFKINDGNRKSCETCSKLPIKTAE